MQELPHRAGEEKEKLMYTKLPAKLVLDACNALLADIESDRTKAMESAIEQAMQKKWLRWTHVQKPDPLAFLGYTTFRWRLRLRTRTREEAIAAASYPGSPYLMGKTKCYRQYAEVEHLRDLALVAVEQDGFVNMSSDDLHWLPGYLPEDKSDAQADTKAAT